MGSDGIYVGGREPGATGLKVCGDLGAAPWSDIDGGRVTGGRVERIGLLPEGTTGGRASVALLVRLPNGRYVIAETTWRLFRAAAATLAATPTAQAQAPDDDQW